MPLLVHRCKGTTLHVSTDVSLLCKCAMQCMYDSLWAFAMSAALPVFKKEPLSLHDPHDQQCLPRCSMPGKQVVATPYSYALVSSHFWKVLHECVTS